MRPCAWRWELKGSTVEAELAATLDSLFEKNVHKAVQEYLMLKSCGETKPRARPARAKAGGEP
jgi:hypothetical protein